MTIAVITAHVEKRTKQKGIFMKFLSKAIFSVLLAMALALNPAPSFAQGQTEAGITLDFEDVEIRNLIRFMAESTGRNFIVDNKVSGKVTVVSPSPVQPQEAFEIFENLLLASGFAIVPAGDAFRITTVDESTRGPVEIAEKKQVYSTGQVVTRILSPKFVNVDGILEIIRPLLSAKASLSSYLPGNKLIVTENYGNIQRIERLVNRLDQPIGSEANVQTIKIQHADVTQVAQVLNRIFSARRSGKDSQTAEIIAEVSSNTIIIVANAADMAEAKRLIKQLDSSADDKVRTLDIVYLRHADASDLSDVLNDIVEKSSADTSDDNSDGIIQTGSFKGDVNIVADESTNALVISAEPADMVTLRDVIKSLDVRRLQVYIEALIMEVSGDVSNQFGIEWRSTDPSGEGLSAFGGQTFNQGINKLSENPLSLPQGFSFGLAGADISFRGEEFANIGFLVNALESDSSVNILSTPQLLTLDNQEAEIIVGDNVPFVTGSFSNDSGSGNPFQTIERQDVGLTLRIKPQISENGFIRLNLYQEISSIGTQGQAADLVTRKRSLRTSVVVPNENMVALGGLMRDDITETEQQVPCLGSLFGVGQLFRNNSVENTKTNLMVFIKPTIINTFGDAQTITQKKYMDMRKLQLGREEKGNVFVPSHQVPEVDMVPEKFRYTEEDYKRDLEKETEAEAEKSMEDKSSNADKFIAPVEDLQQISQDKMNSLKALLGFQTEEQVHAWLQEQSDIQPAAGPSTQEENLNPALYSKVKEGNEL